MVAKSNSDIFMVFVDGKPGLEEPYAKWFCGEHMTDMIGLPGVDTAHAFHLSTLDGEPSPAGLCALYDTENGGKLLATIGKTKGTDTLPHSEIQGKMVWRMLQTVERSGLDSPADRLAPVIICMFSGPWDSAAEAKLWDWLGSAGLSVAAVRQTSISPVQPSRGREYEGILLLTLSAGADPDAIVSAVKDHRGDASARFLLAEPG